MIDSMYKRLKRKSMRETISFTLGNCMNDPDRDRYMQSKLIKESKGGFAQWYKKQEAKAEASPSDETKSSFRGNQTALSTEYAMDIKQRRTR